MPSFSEELSREPVRPPSVRLISHMPVTSFFQMSPYRKNYVQIRPSMYRKGRSTYGRANYRNRASGSRFAKRTGWRSRKRDLITTTRIRGASIVADRTLVRLRYIQDIDFAASGGVSSTQVFRLGSIFAPNLTTFDHQPYGTDEYEQLYQRYRVYKTAYRLTVYNTSSGTGMICAVVYNGNTAPLSATFDQLCENPFAVWRLVPSQDAGSSVIRGIADNPKLLGMTPQEFRDDVNTMSTFAANPAASNYLRIDCSSAVAYAYVCRVELIYYCELMLPEPLAAS